MARFKRRSAKTAADRERTDLGYLTLRSSLGYLLTYLFWLQPFLFSCNVDRSYQWEELVHTWTRPYFLRIPFTEKWTQPMVGFVNVPQKKDVHVADRLAKFNSVFGSGAGQKAQLEVEA